MNIRYGMCVALLLFAATHSPAAAIAFDVASVRLSKAADAAVLMRNGMDSASGRFRVQSIGGNVEMSNWSLGTLILAAWDLEPSQLSGPAWLRSDRYDIAARTSPRTTQAELRQMLQTLLIERFTLVVHADRKELSTYALVVAKGGPKLQPANGDQQSAVVFAPPSRFIGRGSTIQGLALVLARPVGRPVVDKTGIAGRFDFTLSYSPETLTPDADAPGPSIFTALQEQLGLRLEPQKGMVEVLIVDHAERIPTPN
jgi:uncharacterized protein (TIGR03435 family)